MADGSTLIDLSHLIEDGMTTYKGLPAPHICDYWTRAHSAQYYDDGSSFQIGRIDMVANTGTYLDAPFHRFAQGADLAALEIERLASPAVLGARTDARGIYADACGGLGAARWRSPRRRSESSTSPARRCWSTRSGTGTGAPRPTSAASRSSPKGRRC